MTTIVSNKSKQISSSSQYRLTIVAGQQLREIRRRFWAATDRVKVPQRIKFQVKATQPAASVASHVGHNNEERASA
jgi:hypothetical protein